MLKELYYSLGSYILFLKRRNIYYLIYRYFIYDNGNDPHNLIASLQKNYQRYFQKNLDIDLDTTWSKMAIDVENCQTKDDVRSIKHNFIQRNKIFNHVVFTSGTTGTPLKVIFSWKDLQKTYAIWDIYLKRIGISVFSRRARFSGRITGSDNRKLYIDLPGLRTRLFSSYHMDARSIEKILSGLNEYKPKLIEGYPSSLVTISKFMQERGYHLDFKPHVISCTAETLTDNDAELIRKTFGCPVFDQYASSEGAPFIYQCEFRTRHLDLNSGLIHPITGTSEVAISSFRNAISRLHKYVIGDEIELGDFEKIVPRYSCECGTHFPIVTSITGRQDDYLTTKSRGVIQRLDTVYKGVNHILQSQIVQNPDLSIIIYIVTDEQDEFLGNDKQILEENMRETLGDDMKITTILVPDIEKGPNGKFKTVRVIK